jgi:predicted nucleic acid-binding protein
MKKVIVFDAGPIITLTMNNLLWTLKPLEERYDGEFFIGESVKYELIDKPIEGKKFKFQALQTLVYLKNGTIKVNNTPVKQLTNKLAKIMNNIFLANNRPIKIVHLGEVETIAIALKLKAEVVVIDERTMRLLIEAPLILHKILQKKLHRKIQVNKSELNKLKELTKGIKVIRSFELVIRAYELGLLDKYIPYNMPKARKELLSAALWGVKLDGCSVSQTEIDQVISMEGL